MTFGDRMKMRRIELRKTQEDIAAIVMVTKQTIQKYENNIITNVPLEKIELIACALDISPSTLMGWDNEICTYDSEVKNSTIQHRIKVLREEKGMSQQELAEKVGFKTASAVNKIELGLRDISQSKVKAFAEALGTTSYFLLDGITTLNGNDIHSLDKFAEENYIKTFFGKRLRDLRKQSKMTQQDLSNELNNRFGLNVDRVMISKWETGFQTPVAYTFFCLANIFGVSIDYLSGWDDLNPRSSFELSQHEKALIAAYRKHPEMQLPVDKLLSIEKRIKTARKTRSIAYGQYQI